MQHLADTDSSENFKRILSNSTGPVPDSSPMKVKLEQSVC